MTWDELIVNAEVRILGVDFHVLRDDLVSTGDRMGSKYLYDGDSIFIYQGSAYYRTVRVELPENQQVLHHVESHVRTALRALQRGVSDWYRDWRGVSKGIDQMLDIEPNIHDGKYVGGVEWSYRHDTANIRVEYVADVVGTEVLLVTGAAMEEWSAETPLGNRDLAAVSFEEAAAEALAFYQGLAEILVTKLQRG